MCQVVGLCQYSNMLFIRGDMSIMLGCLVLHTFIKKRNARTKELASSPGFSLLPRNNLRMTFDPPERKAEGEPGPFSHVIDDT